MTLFLGRTLLLRLYRPLEAPIDPHPYLQCLFERLYFLRVPCAQSVPKMRTFQSSDSVPKGFESFTLAFSFTLYFVHNETSFLL